MVGQFPLQGPYFPLLELQARWITGVWSGQVPAPSAAMMRTGVAAPPAIDSHNVLALELAEQSGVAPALHEHGELTEALLFGPMLPARYRLNGPEHAATPPQPSAARWPHPSGPPVDPKDLDKLSMLLR